MEQFPELRVCITSIDCFCCNLCGERYTSNDEMIVHYAEHLAPGKCTDCGQGLIEIQDSIYHFKLTLTCEISEIDEIKQQPPDDDTKTAALHEESATSASTVYVAVDDPNRFFPVVNSGSNDCSYVAIDAKCEPSQSMPQMFRSELDDSRTYQCYICKQYFKHRSLVKHIRYYCGNGRSFKCSFCDKAFFRKGHLKEHLNIHTGAVKFTCNICGKSFNRKCTLNTHKRTHSRTSKPRSTLQSSFVCTQCGRCFSRKGHLTEHSNIHLGDKKYICDVCDRQYARRYTLKIHRRTHGIEDERKSVLEAMRVSVKSLTKTATGSDSGSDDGLTEIEPQIGNIRTEDITKDESGKFVCPVCSKAYYKKGSLVEHYAIHTGIRRFQCDICPKAFYRLNVLRMHLRTHSKMVETDAKTAQILNSLPKPTAAHDKKDPRMWECYICHRNLNHLPNLLRHVKHHERNLTCEICGITCNTWANIQNHKRIHTQSYQFICSYCGKGFHNRNNLTEHTFVHTRVLRYKCDTCGKMFGRNSTLEVHKRIHSGHRPYKCKIDGCERAYMHGIDLKRHLYGAHGIFTKKHECKVCGKILSENKLLVAHMKTHCDGGAFL